MPVAQTNGINVYYEIRGEGEPVLVIGGLSIDLTELGNIITELSEGFETISFDNRGAGRSDKPDVPYTIEMMADDAAGLLDSLRISRAHVLGISLGGRIAISLALRRPELVRSLILVSTGARVQDTFGRRLYLLLAEVPRRMAAIRQEHPQPYYAYLRQRKASRGFDATGRLQDIHVPTLILHGRNDRLAPYSLADEMHAKIAGSELVSFKGGHMFFFWRQEEFLEAVEGFLTSKTSA